MVHLSRPICQAASCQAENAIQVALFSNVLDISPGCKIWVMWTGNVFGRGVISCC